MDSYTEGIIRPLMKVQAWLAFFFVFFICEIGPNLIVGAAFQAPKEMLTAVPGNGRSCRRRIQVELPYGVRKRSFVQGSRRPVIHHNRGVDDKTVLLVPEQDVTDQIRKDGQVLVEAEISDKVDECAKDGYLLNAEVTIQCIGPRTTGR